MKRSRKLFRRSRLELAADLDKSMPKQGTTWHRVLVWWLRLMILPYVVIYAPLYFALYLMYGRLAAERAMPWKLKKTDFWKLPYVFIYAPLYFAIYIMYGKQAAEHDMPWHLKNVESSWNPRVLPDEDDEDEWEGRALDMEKRVEEISASAEKRLVCRLETAAGHTDSKLLELSKRISDAAVESGTRGETQAALLDARLRTMERQMAHLTELMIKVKPSV